MSNPSTADRFEFPATNTPIAIFFTVVPTLTTLAIAVAIFKNKLPLFLIAILLVLAVSCILLAKEAANHLGPLTIELTPQEIVVKRLLGSSSYPWSMIEHIKLIDPGATFSDASRDDEKRAGIGLFFRMPDRKEAPPDDRPDALLVTRSGDEAAAKLMKACDRMAFMKRNGSGSRSGKINGTAPAGRKSFRKTANAA